ncbi:MAG: RIP metalloprotease RseP [Myxococcales bacterium]|nr:RIP metalloprotease RseP [Myxococcales bacterium]
MISSFLISIGSFLVLLSIVVIVHEYGHYKTGRLLGIGVEKFAFGFGPALYKWKRDGIEYRINVVPLGGYVKFIGDEPDQPVPDELRSVAFNLAPIYKRMLTVFAGPAMNMVLAFLLFCVIFLVGFPAPAAIIGNVSDDSPAQKAGLRPGDRITSINGEPIRFWHELSLRIADSPDQPLVLGVRRADRPLEIPLTPEKITGPDMLFQFETERGSIGVSPVGMRPLMDVSDANSPAYQAGLRTGDLILTVNGKPLMFLEELPERLAESGELTLGVARGEPNILQDNPQLTDTIKIPPAPAGAWTPADLGLRSGELTIYDVSADGPAKAVGLKRGDRLIGLDGGPIESWEHFTKVVRANPGKPLTLTLIRAGEELTVSVTPKKVETLDMMGRKETYGQVGIQRMIVFNPTVEETERYWNPVKIVMRGAQESWIWATRIVKGIYLIIIGKVPTSSLGGPIAIARMAGESAQMGIIQFLMFMAIISFNLAIINLVPVPIFDGGHLLLFSIEKITGKPLGEKAMALALRIGIAVIVALFLLIFYNDFRWVFFKIKELLGT